MLEATPAIADIFMNFLRSIIILKCVFKLLEIYSKKQFTIMIRGKLKIYQGTARLLYALLKSKKEPSVKQGCQLFS